MMTLDDVLVHGEDVEVVASGTAATIHTADGVPLVTAQVAYAASGLALCRLELRPLGLSLWDAAQGLYVGSSALAGNDLSSNGGDVAIQVGRPPMVRAST
jgi:hypothetical protein